MNQEKIINDRPTRNIKNWAKVLDMNVLTINKRCRKLKDWCFKMPNFSYCHRYSQFKKETECKTIFQ